MSVLEPMLYAQIIRTVEKMSSYEYYRNNEIEYEAEASEEEDYEQ